MGQELEKLKSSSAVTGLNTPGQQCPPNEGIRETGKTTASGILTAGAGPSRGENISSTERATRMVTVADISSIAATPSKRRHRTSSEENKQFDPGGRGEKAPPWNAAIPLPFFFWGEAGRLLVCFVLCPVCVFVFPKMFFFSQVKLISKTFSRDADKSLMYATGGQAFSRLLLYLKMARTSNARFDRSANAQE